MGTRNITSVIHQGKQVVCQYGQWDGYPSYTGAKIIDFLRNSDLEHFKRALENTTIVVNDYINSVSYTGSSKDYSSFSAFINAAKQTLSEKNDRWPEFKELFTHLSQQKDVSIDDLENYFTWSRDTGCDILELIYNRSLDKPPLELAAMTHEYNGDYASDIQGIYVINLDENTLRMTYDDYTCEFQIDDLPKSVEELMMVYEKATEILYELKYYDPNFFSAAAENPNSGFHVLAETVTSRLTASLKEETPDLFTSPQGSFLLENSAHKFILELLKNKAETDKQSLSSKISIAGDRVDPRHNAGSNSRDTVLDR